MHRALRIAMVYGILTGGILFLVAEPLFQRLYHSTDAAGFLKAYSLLIPMLYTDILTDAMTKGLGQQKICVFYNILTSFLDVLFLFFLLPRYGMAGYYFSFLITHLLNFLLSLRRLLKITKQHLAVQRPLRAIGSMVAAIYLASHVSHPLSSAICYTLILFSLLFLLDVWSRRDFQWVFKLIKKPSSL